MTPELKVAVITQALNAVGILIALAWIRVNRVKNKDKIEYERDNIEVRQSVAVLEQLATTKAEKEAYKHELETQGAMIVKVNQQHEKIHQQNAALEARIVALEKELAVATGKTDIITDIAERLTLNLSIERNEQ